MNRRGRSSTLLRLQSLGQGSLVALIMASAAAGCASFKPGGVAKAAFLERAQHREDSRLQVAVAVPSPDEAAEVFDRNLARKKMQPVWVRIENRGDSTAYFLPNLMDTDYYPPLEVAYRYHSACRPKRNAAMAAFFLTNAMPDRIPPRTTRSGFVFTHLDLGAKQVCVALSDSAGVWLEQRYTFVVNVPGLKTPWRDPTWADMTNGMQIVECDDERLRAELEKLPRATTDKHGREEGDPLNLVLVGTPEDLAAMAGCGWDQAERVTLGTGWRSLKSLLLGTHYRYSPISSLYYAGRHQDVAFQKARGSVKLRNHLRLWLTPLRYCGKPVWIGQISRDIGVRWTLQTGNLTTHKINPNVDEARAYLVRDLALGQAATFWGYVKGVGAAPYHEPRRNLTGDPYFTDGLRVVIGLSSEPVQVGQIEAKPWESPPYKTFTTGPAPEKSDVRHQRNRAP